MSREIWQTWSTAEGSKAAFSSAAAALTPSSGGTRHQAPFLLAFNPSSPLLSLCLYSLKVLTAFLDPPAYMGFTMVNKQQYIANWYLKENVCMCVPSYPIWKEFTMNDLTFTIDSESYTQNFNLDSIYIFDLQRKKRVLSQHLQTNRHPCELYNPRDICISNCFLISIYRSFCNLPSLKSMLGIRNVFLAIFCIFFVNAMFSDHFS